MAYAPAGQEGRFAGLLPEGTALLLADGEGGGEDGVEGFGRVLLETMRKLSALGFGAACVLAADSPTLPTSELVRSAQALLAGRSDAVFGESDDGGYYLLGMRRPHPEPFSRIRWSTAHAAADTRARLEKRGLAMVTLRPWFDVDDPAALRRLMDDHGGYAAVHTAAALERFGLRERLRSEA